MTLENILFLKGMKEKFGFKGRITFTKFSLNLKNKQ